MSSALKQLNNYGPLMNMVCGPDINYFVNCYPKFTNFAMQIEPNKCNTVIGFNKTLTFSFNHSGDFAGQTYFKVKLPEIKLTIDNPSQKLLGRWIDYVGCYLFSKISININNIQVSEISDNMMYIIQEFTTATAKRQLVDKMLGMVPELVAPVCTMQCLSLTLPATELIIPLPFWFCTDPSAFIPICCCNSALPIDIIVEVNPLDKLLIVNPNVRVQQISSIDIECFTNYIYIDTATRNTFVTQPQTYLIEQFINNGKLEGGSSKDIQLNISGICKEIFIAAQHKSYIEKKSKNIELIDSEGNTITKFTPSNQHTNFAITAFDQGINYVNTIEGFAPGHHYSTIGTTYGDLIEKIDFNLGGTKLLDTNDSNIFNTVQPLWYHTAAPRNTGLHCYSFALNPENACPTGCIDFTMINNANVLIKLHNTINTQTVSRNATTFANENIDMDYVFAANYPRMAVSAEIAKSPLFNFVVPNISPIMNGSKIDTLYTYTEGQPVYYYYIYAINYNFLLFSNGMCGLKYS